ncbi:hypothetical protein L2E82_28394 [Cichorium intybus]|uniref:Uncharacterized protein n=1 Tax=Cichorium intybus TaxID=13427 RepID=A0ACB9CVW8_CICIN|nr:hypothetical protein L2E82_28394 [Cichorium intybus]
MSPSLQRPPPSVHKTLPKSFSDFIYSAFSFFTLYSPSISSLSTRLPPNRLSVLTIIIIINHHHFATPQSLSDWLYPRLLVSPLPSDSFAASGIRPDTKNIHNLWIELYEGFTTTSKWR